MQLFMFNWSIYREQNTEVSCWKNDECLTFVYSQESLLSLLQAIHFGTQRRVFSLCIEFYKWPANLSSNVMFYMPFSVSVSDIKNGFYSHLAAFNLYLSLRQEMSDPAVKALYLCCDMCLPLTLARKSFRMPQREIKAQQTL